MKLYKMNLKESEGFASALGVNSEATVSQCYNNGTISIRNNQNEKVIYIGGVVGTVQSETKGVFNCYNSGKVVIDTSNKATVGGIVGYNASSVENCYDIATIELPADTENIKVGMLIGKNLNTARNLYYKKYNEYLGIGEGNQIEGIILEDDIVKSENEMKSDNFVELLNSGNNVWKRDNSKNNGYPILFGSKRKVME